MRQGHTLCIIFGLLNQRAINHKEDWGSKGDIQMDSIDYDRNKKLPLRDVILQDIRFAMRMLALRKNARFTVPALLILALGIGANTTIFSVVEGVLLRPLNYNDPERLYTIREVVPQLQDLYPTLPVNAKHFATWQQECKSFEDLTQMLSYSVSLVGGGEPEYVAASSVSWNFFQLLGVQARRGRLFLQEEDKPGANDVVILADSLWRRRYNADPLILGKTILIEGEPNVVVGILPSSFQYPQPRTTTDTTASSTPRPEIFQPLGLNLGRIPELGDFNYEVIARTRPGVSMEQALAELNTVQAQIAATRLGGQIELLALMQPLQKALVGSTQEGLLLLFAAVGAILLIICFNLASLLLVRAKRRTREFSIRLAMGATRSRLVRQLITESLVLAMMGGLLSIVVAYWSIRLIVRSAMIDLPRLNEVSLNWDVLLFALLASTATGLALGILPAWKATRTEPNETLKSASHTTTGGRKSARMRNLLVGAEVGISLPLVVAAGLFLMSFIRVLEIDKGFRTENILTMDVILPATKYEADKDIDRFYTEALRKISAMPGVISAGLVSVLPLQGESWVDAVTLEGDVRPITERPQANYRLASPGYFETVGIPLRAGRIFSEQDRNIRAALISESTAQALWPGQSVIGKKFKRAADNEKPFEIVGVIADIRGISLQDQPGLMIYVPYWERLQYQAALTVRTTANPLSAVSSVRAGIWGIDDQIPIAHVQSMEEVVAGSVSQRRFQLGMILLFAISALLLASIGIYGVVAESVTSRTNEIGIRLALGADAAHIRRMVLREGMTPVVIGLIIGIAASFALEKTLQSFLFGIQATDPWVLVVAALILTLVALAACYLPARRASEVNPLSALRYE